ncbi:response regulator [Clostridium sp. MCC353]|uniref:response regulator n=1 Tax=Clostridium sp. MCC353 TaxID=2592646 RepID=UPI001C00E538|nr:response regulator [Clostridium sp. MCC353]MBT9776847.1 response regulator [Clostridium sp. MCC353]
MYKALIVDDEPLVQIGLQSMITWSDFQISVCGTASNGRQALEMIRSLHPDIVITDIKMPIMNGLELMEASKSLPEPTPEFIILTCYEDFPYIKKALEFQAVDYIIKLGLKPSELCQAVERALKKIQAEKKQAPSAHTDDSIFLQNYKDKFILKLLHNLFDSGEQFTLQARELNLSFHADKYAAAYCLISGCSPLSLGNEQYMTLFQNTFSMLSNLLGKYSSFHMVSLDMKHFCILFEFYENSQYYSQQAFSEMLSDAFEMIHNYFNVTIFCAVGGYKDDIHLISDSHQEARQLLPVCTEAKPVLFYQNQMQQELPPFKNTFNITILKEDIRKAFEEYDMWAFQHITGSISTLFRSRPGGFAQAMDVTSNILHLCLTMIPESEKYLAERFSQYRDSYRSLYNQKNTEQVMDWLDLFSQSVIDFYQSRYKELKNTLIQNIMQYVENHINEKLLLNDVAAIFSISPNYLGHLFKKTTSMGFNEYVTQAKVSKAKYLMFHTDMKIYEIAAQLGFENSFYFSRVFKKIEGCSPRQYLQNQEPDNQIKPPKV